MEVSYRGYKIVVGLSRWGTGVYIAEIFDTDGRDVTFFKSMSEEKAVRLAKDYIDRLDDDRHEEQAMAQTYGEEWDRYNRF